MNIGIIGAGAYAIALADILIENKNKVTLWTKFKEEYNYLIKNRQNKNLDHYIIPKEVNFTMNINEIMNNELVIIATPSETVLDICKEIKNLVNNQYFCIASKGIYKGETLYDIVKRELKANRVGAISGPTFAIDIINKAPIGLTCASKNKEVTEIIKNTFENNRVAFDYTTDIKGITLCGAIKNIMAIGCGIINSLEYPISTEMLFIVRSMYDLQEILKYYNCNKESFLSYAGIGDLVLTCTSEKSRNFTLGYKLGKHEDTLDYLNNTTVEGVTTLNELKYLFDKIDMPVVKMIYNIIYNNIEANKLLEIIAQ